MLLESFTKKIKISELTQGSTDTYEDKVFSITEHVLVED